MSPASSPTFDIHLCTGMPGVCLSDRWGGVVADFPSTKAWLKDSGKPLEELQAVIDANPHCFQDEECFLIGLRNPDGSTGDMAFWVEFEIADEWIPRFLDECTTPKEFAAWKDTLTLFAPAMQYAASKTHDLQKEGEEKIRFHFDFDASYGGAVSALVPISASKHVKDVISFLFRNGLPFPASAHDRLAALSQLRWVLPETGIPEEILSGPQAQNQTTTTRPSRSPLVIKKPSL